VLALIGKKKGGRERERKRENERELSDGRAARARAGNL